MKNRDRYLHILRYLHFTDNRNEPDRTGEHFEKLWKIRNLFEILNDTFSKFYTRSENLTIDEVMIFKQYIKTASVSASKCSNFVTELDTHLTYLVKNRQRTAHHVTATHAIVTELMGKIEGREQKLYMDNFFSSPGGLNLIKNRPGRVKFWKRFGRLIQNIKE